MEQRHGVAVIAADVTDQEAARRILADVRSEVLVLNAGTPPRMGRLDQLGWADFTAPWETDVKGGLYWMQAALNLPLAPVRRLVPRRRDSGHRLERGARARVQPFCPR